MSGLRVVLIALLALLVACDAVPGIQGDSVEPTDATTLADEADEADEEHVPLTIYLRTGTGADAMLEPVTREVRIVGNLPKRAVELLLDGPVADEDLERPWPSEAEVIDVTVDGGVATVDFSRAALTEGPDADGAPHAEALALGALANTLTEFPAIQEVQVTFEGESASTDEDVDAFWGGWGLPPTVTRDETLVGKDRRVSIPDFEDFTVDRQTIGSADADRVHVRSVRLRDRITYLRVVVELADAANQEESVSTFPRSYARTRADEIVLEVTDVDSIDTGALPGELSSPLEPFVDAVAVGEGRRARSVRVTLTPAAGETAPPIHLHTTSSPSRVVLDIMK